MRSADGVALLEVLVALTIAGIVSMTTAGNYADALRVARMVAADEAEMARAQSLMLELNRFGRAELDRRIGSYLVRDLIATVARTAPNLFRVVVASDRRPDRALLVTVVYRPRGGQR